MDLAAFSTTMSILTIVLFIAYMIVTHRNYVRTLTLVQEKSFIEGRESGANWVFDMSVDEYVSHQCIRKESANKE